MVYMCMPTYILHTPRLINVHKIGYNKNSLRKKEQQQANKTEKCIENGRYAIQFIQFKQLNIFLAISIR